MASRYIRDTVLLAKKETTYGTDAVPTGAANAVAISNVRITPLQAQFVPRDLIRQWFGASEELISTYNKAVSFEVEAVGSGTAGEAPAWSDLMKACGWAETVTETFDVRYKPVTNNQDAASIYVYDSGVLHKLLGAKGMVAISLPLGGIPKLKFSFLGIDGGDTAAAPAGVTYAGYQPPQVVNDQFTGDIVLGATLSALGTTPELTGGTQYPSTGLELDMGIKAEYIPLLGSQSVEITDRKAKGQIRLDATAAQEVAFMQAIKDGTLQSLGILHGTVVGRRFGVFGERAQLIAPSKEEIQGKRLIGLDVNFLPTDATGNDEITLVTSF